MKKYFILIIVAVLGLVSCSDDFLTRYPQGSVILEDQYYQLANTLPGTLNGAYSLLYAYAGGDNHAGFGERSFDMYTDLLSGDMALTAQTYGWFAIDEYGQSATSRTSYAWSYYYDIIHITNIVINAVKSQGEFVTKFTQYGGPTNDLKVEDSTGEVVCTYTETEASIAGYYAQALTLRGYAYSQLAMLYTPVPELLQGSLGANWASYKSVPVYTESNMTDPADRAGIGAVFERATDDFATAARCFESFDKYYDRGANKLAVDANVANTLLAYTLINSAARGERAKYERALAAAEKVITYAESTSEYQIIPNESLTTTGFNDVSDKSWLWGQDVTVETATGLASFFGQVDIHSYSYAWSGDTKVIDQNLYDSIYAWDGRKNWFNDGKKDSKFALCPDGKFFSASNPTSTAGPDLDREWLSDNVFLRLECAYLTAAEAAYLMGNHSIAEKYLTAIMDERLNLSDSTASVAYEAYKTTLAGNPDEIKKALIYNWRIEMWGEGYGLQTFRRLTKHIEHRGANHLADAGAEMKSEDPKFTFQLPGGEILYNPWID